MIWLSHVCHDSLSVYNLTMLIMEDSCTGWQRTTGCLKLQVIFCKRATNYRTFLRKMTCKISHPMRLRHPVDRKRVMPHMCGMCALYMTLPSSALLNCGQKASHDTHDWVISYMIVMSRMYEFYLQFKSAHKLRIHVWHDSLSESYPAWIMYGVATMSRLLEIIGLFCKRAL